MSNTVDGKNGADIPEVFAERYTNLFNEATDKKEVEKCKEELEKDIRKLKHTDCDIINECVLKEAINKIAADKTDPFSSIYSNHFHLGSETSVSFLTILIRAMVSHTTFQISYFLQRSYHS